MAFELDIEQTGDAAIIRPRGDLDLDTTAEFYEALRKLSGNKSVTSATLELEGVESLHSTAIAAMSLGGEMFADAGKRLSIGNLRPEHADALRMMPAHLGRQSSKDQRGFFERIGDATVAGWEELLKLNELAFDAVTVGALSLIGKRKMPKGSIIEQAVLMGVDAFPIVALLAFLLGLILAFQSAYQLQQFGANIYVANLVGISMVREFGPLVTGIVLSGRTGSAIAAELGTMTVQEEVDALKTMGLDPLIFLVLPRVTALMMVQPMLTLMADFIGIFGGMVIGTSLLDLSANSYLEQSIQAIQIGDFFNGLSKSVVFASIIAFTGSYTGLNIKGGASGVGIATTRAVVSSIFLIIFADSLFTMATTISAFM